MIDLTPIANAAITLATALITAFLIPYIKSRTTTEQQAQIKAWVRIAVSAAEQIYNGPGRGAEKKEYVQGFLQSKGYKVDFDTLDTLIESEVSLLWQGAQIYPSNASKQQ